MTHVEPLGGLKPGPISPATPEGPHRAIRSAAIIGYGSIGRRHAENLLALGIEHLIVLRRADRANRAFTPPEAAQVVYSLDDLLAASPDVAIVANPTSLHAAVALPLIEAEVPVIVEKPIAARLADAEQLVQTARRRAAWAAMAYPLRFHPAYVMARHLVASGRLGPLLYGHVWFESFLPDWHPWEDYRQSYAARRELGGGVLPTLDHEIDFLNWMLGGPQSISGHIGRSGALQADIDDTALLLAHYANHGPITLRLSLCRQDRQRGFELVFPQATLRYHDDTGRLEQLDRTADAASGLPEHRHRPPGADRVQQRAPLQTKVLWQNDGRATDQMYHHLITAMLDALRTRSAPPVPLQAGLEALDFCRRAGAVV